MHSADHHGASVYREYDSYCLVTRYFFLLCMTLCPGIPFFPLSPHRARGDACFQGASAKCVTHVCVHVCAYARARVMCT